MNNFWQRTITGTLFVIVLVGTVLWSKYSFIGLLFVVSLLGVREYATLFNGRKYKPNIWGIMIAGIAIAIFWASPYFLSGIRFAEGGLFYENYIKGFFIGCLSFPIVAELILTKKPSIINIGLSYAGIVYINLGLFCFSLLGFSHCTDGPIYDGLCYYSSPVLGFLILLWSSDTFAYLTGRAFGKTPLAPKISPKKTWEGSIGGAVCTIGISIILYKTIGHFEIYQWIGLAIVIVAFGTFGDLIESKIKRVLGVKDSGKILPGHGGILDRFDSLFLAAPAAIVFLFIYQMLRS